MKCLRCGKVVAEECEVCPNCGFQIRKMKLGETQESQINSEWKSEQNKEQRFFCAYCGTPLGEMDAFCPKCGKKTSEDVDASSNEKALIKIQSKKKMDVWYLLIIAILCILCISGTMLFIKSRKPDFRGLYQTYCKTYWADVGSDGSYLYIDTNPQDIDDSGLAYPEAAEAIRNINNALGLPESVINEMGQTTFIDGKQTETFEKQRVSVSWRYHPSKGLEVTYTRLK